MKVGLFGIVLMSLVMWWGLNTAFEMGRLTGVIECRTPEAQP